MFRLSCFLDDKHVTQVLHALAGVAKDLQVVPVAPANVAQGKPVPQEGNATERFIAEWKRRKLATVTAPEAQKITQAIGLSPTSYSYLLQQSIQAGLVLKTGKTANSNKAIYSLKGKAK